TGPHGAGDVAGHLPVRAPEVGAAAERGVAVDGIRRTCARGGQAWASLPPTALHYSPLAAPWSRNWWYRHVVSTRGVPRSSRLIALLIWILLAGSPSLAQVFTRSNPPPSGNSKITLRKRLHVNTLITMPGTVEVDFSSLY